MQSANAGGYVDFARFGALREAARNDGATALAEVADEFEAMLVELMLKAADSAGGEDGLFDSAALATYRDMFHQQVARNLARQQDLGLGRALEQQLGALVAGGDAARNAAPAPEPTSATPPPWRRFDATSPYLTYGPTRDVQAAHATSSAPRRARFIADLAPHAEQAARGLGVAPRAILAQAALETGWGEHVMRHADGRSSHNYFGIKAGAGWRGATVEVPTTEYVDGRAVTVRARFRAYPDAAAAFRDYADLLGDNARYRGALGRGGDGAGFARQLAAAGYATDPRYAEKIIAIIETGDWSGLPTPPAQPPGG